MQSSATSEEQMDTSSTRDLKAAPMLATALQSPQFFQSLLQILNREQLLSLLAAAFQSLQLFSALHQLLDRQQLLALQNTSIQSPHFYPRLLEIMSPEQLVSLMIMGFQSDHLYPYLLQILNPDQFAAVEAASSQPTSPGILALTHDPVAQQAALQPSDASSTQTKSRIYPDLSGFQNQDSHPTALAAADIVSEEEPTQMNVDQDDAKGPHSEEAQSRSEGWNRQNINQTVVNKQPGRVQDKIPSQVVEHLDTQQDLYTESGDGLKSGDWVIIDNAKNNKANSHGKSKRDDVPKRSASTDASEDHTAGDGGAAGGAKPSAPQDSAKAIIRVQWEKKIPERWSRHLEKALQTWSSSTLSEQVGKNCNVMNLQLDDKDPCVALVEISPSEAVNVLMGLKEIILKFKDLKQSAEVHFLEKETENFIKSQQLIPRVEEEKKTKVEEKNVSKPEADMFFTAVMDLDKLPQDTQRELIKRFGKDNTTKKLSFSGNFETVERNYRDVCGIVGGPKPGMAAAAKRNDPHGAEILQHAQKSADAFTIPLSHYWYFSHAFRKELLQFEEKFGVKVEAEASVSVSPVNQTSRSSVQEAAQNFIDFYGKSTDSLQSLKIPQTQLETEFGKQMVRNVQTDKTKMMLNLSGDQCELFGPRLFVSRVEKDLNLESVMETERSYSDVNASKMETDFFGASSSWSSQNSRPVEIVIKDAPDPIVMNETHWKLMEKTYPKQIGEIEIKYGVLIAAAPSQGSIKVTITSNNQHVNLESHAHRAFMNLYQKIATSVVSCTLKIPADENSVDQALESCRDCFVCVKEKKDTLKLVGLPKRLSLLIAEIEELTRKPMFDDKTKESLGFPSTFPKSWGLRGGQQGAGAAKWADRPSLTSGAEAQYEQAKTVKAKKPDTSKDDTCPICMDTFDNKKKLKCGHEFCQECLKSSVKSLGEICPVCKDIFGTLIGTQPDGTMNVSTNKYINLPGYPHCGSIEIYYNIPSGVQTDRHPNPGKPFCGTTRHAYLPNNKEGNHVLKLLRKAFEQKLIFTVGTSTTSGLENSVIWNDIHHKTSTVGGPQNYGYPDPDYLRRVKEELKAKGIE